MEKLRMALVVAAVLVALGGLGKAAFVQAEEGKEATAGQMNGHHKKGTWSVEDRLARMTERLNLTEAQQNRIKPLLEDEGKQFKALHNDSTLSREQKRDKAREIEKTTFAKIRPVLTAEQQKKQDEMREKAREHFKKRKPLPEGATQQ